MSTPSQRGTSSVDEGPSKKRRTNISLACRTCREKRTKCDGQAVCKVCQLYDRECVYDRAQDGRRPATKEYVAALEDRVRQLEGRTSAGERSPSASITSPRTNILTGQMRTSGYGSTIHYGPTSTYMHLDEPGAPVLASTRLADSSALLKDFDWNIDWRRDLPQHPCLLTVELHKLLLSVFFSYANGWCHWIDERSFLNGLATSAAMGRPLRDDDYSPFLHHVVLAFACVSMSPDDPFTPSCQVLAPMLAQAATLMIGEELSTPLTTTCRGLMLLGSFHFFSLQRNLGWMTAGMGARTGQILGININPSALLENGTLSQQAHQHRVRVFWTSYIQDVFMNLNVGRRPTLSASDFNIELPAILPTEDAEVWYDHEDRLKQGAQGGPGWASTCFHWSAKLALIASDVHSSIYTVRGTDVDSVEQSRNRIELDIAAWLAGCPPVMQIEYWQGRIVPPHIITALAATHHVRILLHRPACYTYQTSDSTLRTKAVNICLTAARQILQLVRRFTARKNTCYILPNALFAAGTTFLLVSTRNESSQQLIAEASADMNECARLMLQFPTPASQVGRDILQRLCAEWQQNPSEQINIHATNKNEAVKLLSDSNSDMVKLLKELGWQQPNSASNGTMPQEPPDRPVDPVFMAESPNPIQNPNPNFGDVSNSMPGVGSYDPLGWPEWFLNDITSSGNSYDLNNFWTSQ